MNLLKALITVSGFTLISRILGFVRDFVIAYSFKTGTLTDAFFVAFKLPNLLRRLFAEGAFSQAFVPILGDYKNRRDPDETRTLINRVATLLSAILLIITVIGIAGAALLVFISAPGFYQDAEKFALTVTLTRITFPYIFFMSLLALVAAILNTWNHFALPALAPTLLNLSLIIAALFFSDWFDPPVLVLGWAVFFGGLFQLLLQFPALHRIGMIPRWAGGLKACWQDEGVKRILRLMAPAILGVSVAQISLLINTVFASFLESGSVSWLYFADRLMEFPAGLLGAALGTILLPSLSRAFVRENLDDYQQLLDWGLRLTILLAAPAAVAISLLALPLVSTLFMHGKFGIHDALQTQAALMAYGIGLIPLILVKILAPGFYARQNVKTPVKIAIIALVTTQLLNLLLIWHLKHIALVLSISIAAWINAGLLYFGLTKQKLYRPQPGWKIFLFRITTAILLMTLILAYFQADTISWLTYTSSERFKQLSLLVLLGITVYFTTLIILGLRLKDFTRRSS